VTNDRNLLDFLGINPAADIDNDHNLTNLGDSVFNSISGNIKDCKYYDLSSLSNDLQYIVAMPPKISFSCFTLT